MWEPLDKTLNTSDVLKCENLCRQKVEFGCCWIGDGIGCWWRNGSSAGVDKSKNVGDSTQLPMSVTCYPGISSTHHIAKFRITFRIE